MTDKIAFFLPTRKGSQRVKHKNTRKFASFEGGLLENKLTQLLQTTQLDEIILSNNDPECLHIAEPFLAKDSRLKIVERPEWLCLDATNLQDLILYVPTISQAEHFLWGHVTTPLVTAAMYDKAILAYKAQLKEGYNSLVSVVPFKNFLLNGSGKVINNNTALPWPRTQDLETLYEVNHAMFMASRQIYLAEKNRVGTRPFLYEMDKISSIDVDWEDDFRLAEMMYGQINALGKV